MPPYLCHGLISARGNFRDKLNWKNYPQTKISTLTVAINTVYRQRPFVLLKQRDVFKTLPPPPGFDLDL